MTHRLASLLDLDFEADEEGGLRPLVLDEVPGLFLSRLASGSPRLLLPDSGFFLEEEACCLPDPPPLLRPLSDPLESELLPPELELPELELELSESEPELLELEESESESLEEPEL